MAAAMTTVVLRLLVIFLGISQLICCFNALPITRIERLMHNGPDQVLPLPRNTHMVAKERSILEEAVNVDDDDGRKGRLELDDYPGSGANNRHTPHPQFGRCVDC